MATAIEIDPYESEDAAVIKHHYDDAVVHHEQTSQLKLDQFTVMMDGGRLQGITGRTREDSIRHTARVFREGGSFIDRRQQPATFFRVERHVSLKDRQTYGCEGCNAIGNEPHSSCCPNNVLSTPGEADLRSGKWMESVNSEDHSL